MIFDGFLIGFQKLDLHHWPRNEIRIMKFRVWTFSCRPTGWRFLERIFFLLDDVSRFEKNGFRRVLCNLWNLLKSLKPVCSQFTVMLRSVKRSHRYELSFCAKWNGVAESIGESMMDSATPDRDVLRAEWHDGWLIMNIRTLDFVWFVNFPEYLNVPMNSLCWQMVILREAKRSRRISPLSKHQHNSLKLCPPSSIFSLTFKFSCVHSKIQKKVFLQLIQWHQW